jgi:fructose-1,6-bisphosphatase I
MGTSDIGTTLSRFIHLREKEHPGARGEFSEILEAIGLAGRIIARAVSRAGLADALGLTGVTNVQGEGVKKLDQIANDAMISCLEHITSTCLLASEENEETIAIREEFHAGDYAIAFDPLDGSGNTDTNMPMGTIFSIYRRLSPAGQRGELRDLLRVGTEQVAAGYVVYGSSTMLVYTCGNGAHGFTLDESLGAWLLSHPGIRAPARGRQYSLNSGNRAYWRPGVAAYVAALESVDPARKRPLSHRYAGALVADFHRVLLEGGIFMYPADTKDPKKPGGKLRLLYECAPLALVAEQAGGAATDGRGRILDIPIETLHQRTALFIGSREDVEEATRFARADA